MAQLPSSPWRTRQRFGAGKDSLLSQTHAPELAASSNHRPRHPQDPSRFPARESLHRHPACGSPPLTYYLPASLNTLFPSAPGPSASHAEKVQTLGQVHKSPGVGRALLCPRHPGWEAGAGPCQLLIRCCCCCCCCWAPSGCSHHKFPESLGTGVASTRPNHSEPPHGTLRRSPSG